MLVAAVSAATVGALVASRRPGHRVGWLLLALGLAIAVAGFSNSYSRYGLVARPGAVPAAIWLAGAAAAVSSLPGRHRLHPAAHPHRLAAVAPLALVGQGHRSRAGDGLPVEHAGPPAAVPRATPTS